MKPREPELNFLWLQTRPIQRASKLLRVESGFGEALTPTHACGIISSANLGRAKAIMTTIGKKFGAAVGVFLFAAANLVCAQDTAPKAPETSQQQAASSTPDHARAYYHYMLARRYRELAGIYNRSDFVDRAISEYKQAMEADPGSLFLRTELAELYWRIGRVDDAITAAEDVLKVNPNDADAHKLLGHIYLRNLSQAQPDKTAQENLTKAIQNFEALVKIDPSDTNSYVILGRLYKLNNQGDKAEATFKKVLDTDPDSRDALLSLTQLYLDQGEYDQATDLLKNVPDDEMDPSLLGMLAYAYGQNHEVDKSAETFEKALSEDPDNQELRRSYAEVLMANGRDDAARVQLEKILQSDPQDGSTYLRLGQLDRQTGKFDQARQELDRARTLMPDNPEVPYQQALLEDSVGNEDKAAGIVEDLLKKTEKPDGQYSLGEANNRAIFLERLGMIYRTQEKYDQAIAAFQQILTLGKSQAPRAEGLIVETLRLSGKPGQALKRVQEAVQKYPEDRSLKMLQASLLGEQGQVDQAIKELQGLLDGTPNDRETELVIAQVYSQAKRYPEAETAVQKALALSTQPDDQIRANFILGSIYEREKKYDLAEEQFKKVLAADPLNSAAANYLGYMLADRGVRLEESVKYIQKALQTDPNNGAYLDSLGWAYFKMNRLDLAEANLEKAASIITSDPTIHEHLGRVYLHMGKTLQAEKEWERALQDWPHAASSDFDANQAAKLRKELDELKHRLAVGQSPKP
jgi:tetratricopeptide (TPR) repeat protein